MRRKVWTALALTAVTFVSSCASDDSRRVAQERREQREQVAHALVAYACDTFRVNPERAKQEVLAAMYLSDGPWGGVVKLLINYANADEALRREPDFARQGQQQCNQAVEQ